MAIDLVGHRIEKSGLVARVAGDDLVRAYDPDADAFLAPRVHVARQLDGELRVGGVQAAAVLMVEPCLAANEHFPQRPFANRGAHACVLHLAAAPRGGGARLGPARRRAHAASSNACLRACAMAASRTQAPSFQAATRAARRSRLHGPSPPTTCQNSFQSIGPKS